MSNLALILLRGNTENMILRNIKCFCEKPIIAYSIEAALRSNVFDKVVVLTDKKEVEEIALKYGAAVFSGQICNTYDVYVEPQNESHEISKIMENMGEEYSYVCSISSAAPFVSANKIKEGYNNLRENRADVLIPVMKYRVPPQSGMRIGEDGFIRCLSPEYKKIRRNDMEPCYHDAMQFRWYSVKNCASHKEGLILSTLMLSDVEETMIKMDSDWRLQEMLYQRFANK